MRLKISTSILLVISTIALGLALQNFSSAREGAMVARLTTLGAAAVALASILLLSRIIIKVSDDGPSKKRPR